MVQYDEFKDIPGYTEWNIIKKIEKGWSQDAKYYVQNNNGEEYLLRISDISTLERKRQEYENLNRISQININMSMPIDFGICSNNCSVYTLLSWVSGSDAETVLPKLSKQEQYKLGKESGRILKSIHTIPAPESQPRWGERFNKKIDRNIRNYNSCGIVIPHADKIIQYINDNRYLLEGRNQTFQHGDFHVGNMVITEKNEIGIIDFNRYDFGDPWEEFNRIVWSVHISVPFAIGQIDGYFNKNVPNEFFKLMALYIASNALSSVPWAIPYGDKEVETMLKNINDMLEYYDCFNSYIPKWYNSALNKGELHYGFDGD